MMSTKRRWNERDVEIHHHPKADRSKRTRTVKFPLEHVSHLNPLDHVPQLFSLLVNHNNALEERLQYLETQHKTQIAALTTRIENIARTLENHGVSIFSGLESDIEEKNRKKKNYNNKNKEDLLPGYIN